MLTAFKINTLEKVLNITQKKHIRKLLTYPNMLLMWQGHKDLNPEPTVLETAALPIELYPYI